MSTPSEEEPYTGPPPTRPPDGAPPGWYGRPPTPVPGWPVPAPYGYPPPAVQWDPPPGTPPHDEPRAFLRIMRSRTWAWWRPVAGLALLAAVYGVAAAAVVLVALVTGVAPDLAMLDLVDPAVLLVTNISLILLIPCVWLVWAVAHGMRMGWSASVLARIRPRLFLPYVQMALLTLGVGILLSVAVGLLVDPAGASGPEPDLGWLLLVVILTTPLQSAAEEYLFRGYLSQTIAGWFRSERLGAVGAAVVTAAAFSLAHAPGDLWTFFDRFLFALAASATVWLTGGLEAAIVLHAVNNVLVFGLAGLLGDGIATDEAPSGTGFLFVLITTVSMAGYVALVARSRDRLRPERWTAAQDLRPPPQPVPAPWQPAPLYGW